MITYNIIFILIMFNCIVNAYSSYDVSELYHIVRQENSDIEWGEGWTYSDIVNNINKYNVSYAVINNSNNEIVVTDSNFKINITNLNFHAVHSIPYMTNKIIDLFVYNNIKYEIEHNNEGNEFPPLLLFYLYMVISLLGIKIINYYNTVLKIKTNSSKNGRVFPLFSNSISHEDIITFKNVAGCEEAKYELVEIVQFLNNPQKFIMAGAKAPGGCLLEGPPGTGKTLLARAIAGEAGVDFISVSGSDFIEMYVGVGASRIRDLFSKAMRQKPCIIFIDEIDAIGHKRSGDIGGHDEYGQTLNQLLTCMDGFDKKDGIIVIGATNRVDILDPALVRPGRFDRKVTIGVPDRLGREQILNVHLKNKRLDENIDYSLLYDLTIGFSGAELANLANEAAILSIRYNYPQINNKCIMDAFEKVTIGLPKIEDRRDKEIKEMVSYHECGHAINALFFEEFFVVRKITINANNKGAGGYTLYTPHEKYSNFPTKRYMLATLVIALGGRAAEILLYRKSNNKLLEYDDKQIFPNFNDLNVTMGASNDLQQANKVARNIVHTFGITCASNKSNLDKGFCNFDRISDNSQKIIDEEIELLINYALDTAIKILELNDEIFINMSKILVIKRTLSQEDIADFKIKYVEKII